MPVWRRNAAFDLVACNEAYAGMVEVGSPQEVIDGALELIGGAPGARREAQALARRAQEAGETCRLRRYVVSGGERLSLELVEVPLPDGGTIGFAQDRTTESELKAELKRHIDAHSQVLSMLSVGVAIVSPDFRLQFFNPIYSEIFDLEESFLRTRPRLEDLFHRARAKRKMPEHPDFEAFLEAYRRKLNTLIEPVEDLLYLPDQRTIRRISYPYPLGGALMIFEDVTDTLALESSYNTLLAVRQETIENLQEAVSVIGTDGRLKLANLRFFDLWNVPEKYRRGEPHIRELSKFARKNFLVDDEAWKQLEEVIIAEATEPSARHGRMELAGGRIIDWVQVPLPDAASLFTYVDVTASIAMERALLERNEALETADRLKSEFIANISYELRTPLNAINGFGEMLDGEYFGKLNDRQHEYARAIVQSAQSLARLIDDILDLAGIDAGYIDVERSDIEAQEVLDSVRALAAERATVRGHTLKLEAAENAGWLRADERRLKQAVFNLVSNAVKFTPEGGEITLGARGDDTEVVFYVTDTGPGIDPAQHVNIFKPFDHGLEGPRRMGAGAGLGLALVKRLTELHGGSVEIDSAPGRGTTVTCRLPRNPEAAENREG